MNKLIYILLGAAVAAGTALQSCTEEEVLVPGEPDRNFFEVDPAATDPESQLRRDFYNRTGIYLSFNDTIGSYFDAAGKECYETVDFHWGLTSTNSTEYIIKYLTDFNEKKALIEAFEKYYLPHVNTPGGIMKPHAIVAFDYVKAQDYYHYPIVFKTQPIITCWRASGISLELWRGKNEVEMESVARSILRGQLDGLLSDYSTAPVLNPFYESAGAGLATRIVSVIPDWVENDDPARLYEYGFLTFYDSYYDDPTLDEFPGTVGDLRSYKDALFNTSEEEFMEQYGMYPKIVERYNIFKQIIADNYGIIFDIQNQ